MYQEYWGFKEKPFENTPDPRFMYYSPKHEEGLMRLFYAAREKKGAAMLSGDYGSGKTLLTRVIAAKLISQGDHYKVALIVNPAIPAVELLSEIVYQFEGVVSKQDRKLDILHNLNDILYKNMREEKHSVVIVDEAQAIKDEETFEELRLLLNFQSNDMFLLTLLLIGQPELKEKIDRIPQLKQRLSIQYHLETLDFEQTREYIQHRLEVAGKKQRVFSDEALRVIYGVSRGVPREINNICDMALVVGFGEKVTHIDERITQEVIKDFRRYEDGLAA